MQKEITREIVEGIEVEGVLEAFYDRSVQDTSRAFDIAKWRLREWCEKLITAIGTRGLNEFVRIWKT